MSDSAATVRAPEGRPWAPTVRTGAASAAAESVVETTIPVKAEAKLRVEFFKGGLRSLGVSGWGEAFMGSQSYGVALGLQPGFLAPWRSLALI